MSNFTIFLMMFVGVSLLFAVLSAMILDRKDFWEWIDFEAEVRRKSGEGRSKALNNLE